MLKSVTRVLGASLAGAPLIVLGVQTPRPYAGAGDAAEAQACGGASYCVSVSYDRPAAPSGDGGGGYVASVPPKCYWDAWKDPAGRRSTTCRTPGTHPLYSGKEWVARLRKRPRSSRRRSRTHPDATWYRLECPGLEEGDWDGMVEYAGLAARGNGWSIPNMTRLVDPGERPARPGGRRRGAPRRGVRLASTSPTRRSSATPRSPAAARRWSTSTPCSGTTATSTSTGSRPRWATSGPA